MTSSRTHAIDTAIHWTSLIVLSFVPLFFLPLTQNYYDTNKYYLLALGALFLMILWGLRIVLFRTLRVSISSASIGFGALVLAALAGLFVSQNKTEALMSPNGFIPFLSLFIIAFMSQDTFDAHGKVRLKLALLIGATTASAIAVYQYVGVGHAILPGVSFLSDKLWTPVGASSALLAYVLLVLPLAIAECVKSIQQKLHSHAITTAILAVIMAGGIILTAREVVPKLHATTMPLFEGWHIMIETIKQPKQLLFGAGAENYLSAYTQHRSVSLNATSLWNVRFISGSSFILHTGTTLGLVGIIGILILLWNIWVASRHTPIAQTSLLLGVTALVLTIPHVSLLAVLASLLFLAPSYRTLTIPITPKHRLLAFASFLLLLFCVTLGMYGLLRSYAGEYVFLDSIRAANDRNGTRAYARQRRAIELNPWVGRYHIANSQTSLILANTIIANTQDVASPSSRITLVPENRQLVVTLVQQAINEAKIAIRLLPEHVTSWENLAQIYKNMTGIAQGTENWTIAAYQKSVQLDPVNPILRFTLGGLYTDQNRLEEAQNEYAFALMVKPGLISAYEGLARVFGLNGQNDKALLYWRQLQELVVQGTADWQRAQQEIERLSELPPQAPATTQTPVQGATPPTAPVIVPRLTLPENSAP
ncbi:tetratricopeptide repeat protein [Patescibacteria group bacterium]|nr:tetratricopeptide repeat protein [Patescibacteria group bacterium]